MGKEALFRRVLKEWPQRGGEPTYLTLEDGDGNIVLRTLNYPDFLNNAPATNGVIHSPDGRLLLKETRVIQDSLDFKNPVRLTLTIGNEAGELFLSSYRKHALLVLVVGISLSFFVAWEIAKRGIRPLEDITDIVNRVGPNTLDQRILPNGNLPLEMFDLARAFNRMLDELQDAFQRLSQFSADIAHEIRTPLTIMLGELEVAATKARTVDEYQDVLSSALEESQRLKQLIESLLFIARAERLPSTLERESVDIVAEAREMVDYFEAVAAESEQKIQLHTTATHLWVTAERVLLQRVIGNLLSNAIKYSPPKTTIDVTIKNQATNVTITIRDQGHGIATDEIRKIFDRFYRVDQARTHSPGGFGLGLSIVKSIVDLHGGEISIQSEPGSGTCVMVSWPVNKV